MVGLRPKVVLRPGAFRPRVRMVGLRPGVGMVGEKTTRPSRTIG